MAKTWLKNCIWYKAPTINSLTKLTAEAIKERENSYFSWYQEKNGVTFDPATQLVESDVVQELLIEDPKIIGIKDGLKVVIRKTSPSGTCNNMPWAIKEYIAPKGYVFKHKTSAPSLYIVSLGGKRVDSFLSHKKAKELAERLLAA